VDTSSNVKNCGGCGTACTTGTTPGCCGSFCYDLDSNMQHCGSCQTSCSTSCSSGACQ
jgi:hypothetical protein